jgi:hypothetical protein
MGLKRWYPDVTFSGNKVTPEEMDRYEVYTIINPSVGSQWFGTFPVAGTSATGTYVPINWHADYPRNAVFQLVGSAVGMTGSVTLYGSNQFGQYQTETIGFGSTDNGGSAVGTKIWAQIGAGTLTFGTAVGNGTARISACAAGTTCYFGLPSKIAGSLDIKNLTVGSAWVSTTVNGGTFGAFALGAPQHCIKAPLTIGGTSAYSINVWFKPTFDASAESAMANLTAKV